MRGCFIILAALAAVTVYSEQSGTPARLEVITGKSVNVFLQSMEEGTLVFQAVNSNKDRPAPVDKIKSLTFYPKYDALALEQTFNDGDYAGVVALYGRALAPYWGYMAIENNLRDDLTMMTKAYLETGNLEKVAEASLLMQESADEKMVAHGQAFALYVALGTNDIAAAESILGEIESEAAGLYLGALIERGKGNHRAAMQLLTDVIAGHGNDMDWMPASEMMSARLYLDMGYTNSAAATARQVKKIYEGTPTANDAKQFAKPLPVVEFGFSGAAQPAVATEESDQQDGDAAGGTSETEQDSATQPVEDTVPEE